MEDHLGQFADRPALEAALLDPETNLMRTIFLLQAGTYETGISLPPRLSDACALSISCLLHKPELLNMVRLFPSEETMRKEKEWESVCAELAGMLPMDSRFEALRKRRGRLEKQLGLPPRKLGRPTKP